MSLKKNLHLLNTECLDKDDFGEFLQELGFDDFRVIVPNFYYSSWPLIRDFKNPTFAQYENWWEDYNSLKEVLHCRFSLYDNIYIWQGLHTINTQMFIYMMCALTNKTIRIVDIAPALEYKNNLNRSVFHRELLPSEVKSQVNGVSFDLISRMHCLENIHEVTTQEHESYAKEWERLLSDDTGLRTISADGTIRNIPVDSIDDAIMNAVNKTEEFRNALHVIWELDVYGNDLYNKSIFGEKFDYIKHDYSIFFYYERLKMLMRQGKMQIRRHEKYWEALQPVDLSGVPPEDFVNGVCIADHHFVEIKKL